MPLPEVVKALAALLFVLGLIAFSAWVLRKIALEKKWLGGLKPSGTLSVKETLYLDARHTLVRVASKRREHLILLSSAAPVVVESEEAGDA